MPALLEAGAVFDEDQYTQAGIKLGQYLQRSFEKDQQLLRIRIDDQLQTPALFEDYAYLANAYLSLFDHTQDNQWLNQAQQLMDLAITLFWDTQVGGFYNAKSSHYLPTQQKEASDGALPGANAIAYQVLGKLKSRTPPTATTVPAYNQLLLDAFAQNINQYPLGHASFVVGINQGFQGALNNIAYSHTGRVRAQVSWSENQQLRVQIDMPVGWHINANQVLQSGLVATQVRLASDQWSITDIHYPKPIAIKLGFSKDKLLVYKEQALIDIQLSRQQAHYTPPQIELSLQACSDQVCLAPETVTLIP